MTKLYLNKSYHYSLTLFTIEVQEKNRELIALLNLFSWCLVMVE